MPGHPLRVGTRGSPLARAQTETVCAALRARWPDQPLAVVPITTQGDVIADRPLAAIGGNGVFVTAIEEALGAGRIDLAVHSAKDLPSTLPGGMRLAAILARADARDVLVSRTGPLTALPPGARVGTGSPRRACQLRALRPDLVIADIRGNVDTRLRKLAAGEYDAVVLAGAGLVRLGRTDVITEWLPPTLMVPAPGQGALAVEVRADDAGTAALLAPLDDAATRAAVTAERGFLAALHAGCASAVAAHAVLVDGRLSLRGLIGAPDGRRVQDVAGGPPGEAATIGVTLAMRLLAQGGGALLADGRGDAGGRE